MGRRTLLLIASVLVAALGTALIWLYVQGAESRAQQDQALVPVLVLTGQAASGTTAEELRGVIAVRRVPADLAGAGSVRSLQQVAGQKLSFPGIPGQLLLTGMFTTGTSSSLVPKRAYVALTVTDPDRVPALLKPRDTVAVYGLPGGGGGAGTRSATLVVPSVQVLTIGNAQQQPGTGTGAGTAVPVTIVGFDVTPDQGKALIDMRARGEVPVLELLGQNATAVP